MSKETRLGDISEVRLGAQHRDLSATITLPVKVISVGDLVPSGVNMSSQETLELLPARAKKYELVTDDVIVAVRGTIFKTAIFAARADSVFVLGPNLARVRLNDPNLALLVAAAIGSDQSSLSVKFQAKRSMKAGGFIGKEDIEDFLFRLPDVKALGELITLLKGAQEESQILNSIISNRRKVIDDLVYRMLLKKASS